MPKTSKSGSMNAYHLPINVPVCEPHWLTQKLEVPRFNRSARVTDVVISPSRQGCLATMFAQTRPTKARQHAISFQKKTVKYNAAKKSVQIKIFHA